MRFRGVGDRPKSRLAHPVGRREPESQCLPMPLGAGGVNVRDDFDQEPTPDTNWLI